MAAKKVLNKYSMITVLNLVPIPLFAFDMAEATKTNIKIGATALRALTNNFPGNPMSDHLGTMIPKIAPIIRPIMIFNIKLDSVHFFNKFMLSED